MLLTFVLGQLNLLLQMMQLHLLLLECGGLAGAASSLHLLLLHARHILHEHLLLRAHDLLGVHGGLGWVPHLLQVHFLVLHAPCLRAFRRVVLLHVRRSLPLRRPCDSYCWLRSPA